MSIHAAAGFIPPFVVSDRLRKAREAAGLEQGELAAELGVSRGTISNYERGTVEPRRAVVMAWSMRTGVDLHWLETGEAPSPDGGGASVLRARRDSNPQPSDWEPRRLAAVA